MFIGESKCVCGNEERGSQLRKIKGILKSPDGLLLAEPMERIGKAKWPCWGEVRRLPRNSTGIPNSNKVGYRHAVPETSLPRTEDSCYE